MPKDLAVSIIYKMSRAYLRRRLSIREKHSIITYHYDRLMSALSTGGLNKLADPKGIPYMEMAGKSGQKYGITASMTGSREGEIRFQFIQLETGAVLASLIGVISPDKDGSPTFVIGGMQGPKPPVGNKEIAFATHDLNNLRPKQAVLHCVCAFAEWLGVKNIIAPKKTSHVAYYWFRNIFMQRHLHGDFDNFWAEFSTTTDNYGDPVIALPLRRRTLAEVPSKRRKDWVQRYAKIDAIAYATSALFIALSKQPGLEKAVTIAGETGIEILRLI